MSLDNEDFSDIIRTAQSQLYNSQFDAALTTLSGILDKAPEHLDALYMSTVCQRYAKRSEAAFHIIEKLKNLSPEFGRNFQEEGHLYRELGQTENALRAFAQACLLNPALIASWRAQSDLLNEGGRKEEAAQASAQADRLAALPRELLSVTNFIYEGKTLKAEALCRHFLKNHPHHIEGMRLLAEIGVRFGVLDEADFLLESAIEFDPENIQLRLDYIQVLRKRQKIYESVKQARYLLDKDNKNPVFQSTFAIESLQAGDFDTALAMFDKVLEKLPNDPSTLTSRGHVLKTSGNQKEAITSYRLAYRAKPDHADAYYSLANLKTYQFNDEEVAAMRTHESQKGTLYRDRIHFCFALGKAYEDRRDYEKSFLFYENGNRLKCAQSGYTAETMGEELKAQIATCTSAFFENSKGHGCQAPDPIFIVGLPRAGSTLLEQILASHSQVDGTLELPNILTLSHNLRGRSLAGSGSQYPKIMSELTHEQLCKFGEAYIQDTQFHRQGAPFFTDKMPNNFRHIGLIHSILPNAKIIDARRHPMSCCFSGFKQLFAEGQEFTYSLDNIGRYYKGYVDLMDHWDRVLPGKVLRVQYEDVVDDLEAQVRRILKHCHLPFEQSCIDFYKTKREVRTASSEQVREPINTRGLAQWENYEPYLGELTAALGDSLQNYRA